MPLLARASTLAAAWVRPERHTDGDGSVDKWEVFDGSRLASVAFDTTNSGQPDRRLTYAPDGTARVEVLADAPGQTGRSNTQRARF